MFVNGWTSSHPCFYFRFCAVFVPARSKAASTLSDVLAGIQGGQPGFSGEALRKAVMEACGWGEAGDCVVSEGPLLEVVRARVQVRTTSGRVFFLCCSLTVVVVVAMDWLVGLLVG